MLEIKLDLLTSMLLCQVLMAFGDSVVEEDDHSYDAELLSIANFVASVNEAMPIDLIDEALKGVSIENMKSIINKKG